MPLCSKCKVVEVVRAGYCAACMRRYMREYMRAHANDPGVREKARERQARWRAANPDYNQKHREKNAARYQRRSREKRLAKYGLTAEQYEQRLVQQHGRCAICGIIPDGWMLAVDHDHETGRVRGLLCGMCNQGLGMFEDAVEFLERAIAYLKA